jgi:Zn-dependent protease
MIQIRTSQKEIYDLITAWVIISVAFAIVLKPADVSYLSSRFPYYIILAGLTVGLGFLLHEMAHKVVAQRYNCWAEFRADIQMLLLALLMSFFGFIFAAPGAVMIYGKVSRKQNGIISLAGPLTNFVLAAILLTIGMFTIPSPLMKDILGYGFMINAWLALFNLIPFLNFDGAKIWRWNKLVYILMLVFCGVFVYLSFSA